jgi:hypothetical protein
MAWIEWEPAAKDEVAGRDAKWTNSDPVPDVTTAAVPKAVLPSRKVTVPVGFLVLEGAVIRAVNVTLCPAPEGFNEELTLVAVAVREANIVSVRGCDEPRE